ncbi:MAG: DUF748 domain-containing protein [Candidatus Delongbacteria bacterium]|nr:DUF748 domain-containing protein [Candidatus Delongbacteria bacterium]
MAKNKTAKSKKKKRLIFNPLFWLGIFFLLFIILFYLVIPIAVKMIARNYVKDNYDRNLEIGSFSLNPFGFTVTIDDLALYDSDGETLIKWKRFYVDPEIIPMMSNEIVIDKVALVGYEINVRKFKDGKFNFSDFLEQKSDSTAVVDTVKVIEKDSEPWIIRLNELKILKMDLSFNDKTADPELNIGLDDFHSTIQNFTINTDELTDWDLRFNINGGDIELKGTMTIEPMTVDTKLKITKLPLSTANGFIPSNMTLSVKDGYFNSEYDINIAIADSSKINVSAKGSSNISGLNVIETKSDSTLFSFNDLSFNDLALNLDPMKVDISEIVLDNFYSNVSISKDKRLNINDALGIEPLPEDSVVVEEEEPVAVEDSVEVEKPDVFIRQIRLVNNSVYFTDNSLPLSFATKIEKLNTTIDSIDLKDEQRTDISLQGIIDDVSKADISGSLYLADPNYNTDIKISIDKLNLIHYSPFSAKFVGLLIDKGSFSLDLLYKVERSQLEMQSTVSLNKLTFGKDYPSEDATSLPVKLPIALLKDSDGNIEHEINATGDLSDPQVSLSGIIFKSVSQILLNVAASPFKLLGKGLSMFAPEDLNHVDFVFGSTQLDSLQMQKLSGISEALLEKPALRISITGIADRKKDRFALAELKYDSLTTLDSLQYIEALQSITDSELNKLSNKRAQNILKQLTMIDLVPAEQVAIVEGELSERKDIKLIECKLELGVR